MVLRCFMVGGKLASRKIVLMVVRELFCYLDILNSKKYLVFLIIMQNVRKKLKNKILISLIKSCETIHSCAIWKNTKNFQRYQKKKIPTHKGIIE